MTQIKKSKKQTTQKTSAGKASTKTITKSAAMDHSLYQLQAEICGALASPVRLHILDLLAEGEKTVGDLLEVLDIPKANLSQHLAVLKDAGILNSRRQGLYIYMSLAIPRIKEACSLVKTLLAERIALEEKKNSELVKKIKSLKA